MALPRFADDCDVYHKALRLCLNETRSLAENDWLKMGVPVTKADGYGLIERMAMVINVEELQEIEQSVKRAN